jgi:hypothetical protein
MRALLVLALAVMPVDAQSPLVRLINATRPASGDFQIGDSSVLHSKSRTSSRRRRSTHPRLYVCCEASRIPPVRRY